MESHFLSVRLSNFVSNRGIGQLLDDNSQLLAECVSSRVILFGNCSQKKCGQQLFLVNDVVTPRYSYIASLHYYVMNKPVKSHPTF